MYHIFKSSYICMKHHYIFIYVVQCHLHQDLLYPAGQSYGQDADQGLDLEAYARCRLQRQVHRRA